MKGSTFVAQIKDLPPGGERNAAIYAAVVGGCSIAWSMMGVPLEGGRGSLLVASDVFAIGELDDFVRVPLDAQTAQRVADHLGFLLPTTKIVDLIWKVASVKLAPMPMTPAEGFQYDATMQSVDRFTLHNEWIEVGHNGAVGRNGRAGLVAGHKKDVVITNRLLEKPDARGPMIYGWHQLNGTPIQSLSGAHREDTYYGDYSHSVRAVSPVVRIDGEDKPLEAVLADPALASLVSSEGPLRVTRYAYGAKPPPLPVAAVAKPPPIHKTRATVTPMPFVPDLAKVHAIDCDLDEDCTCGTAKMDPAPPRYKFVQAFVQARNYKPAARKVGDVLFIVEHTIEGAGPKIAENVAAWFAGAQAPMASAHYVTDRDSTLQCVRDEDVAWAAPGANKQGIQIENEGWARYTRDQWLAEPNLATLRRSAELTAELCQKWNVPARRVGADEILRGAPGICGHVDVSRAFKKSTHTDPGSGWPWDVYLIWVADALAKLG